MRSAIETTGWAQDKLNYLHPAEYHRESIQLAAANHPSAGDSLGLRGADGPKAARDPLLPEAKFSATLTFLAVTLARF